MTSSSSSSSSQNVLPLNLTWVETDICSTCSVGAWSYMSGSGGGQLKHPLPVTKQICCMSQVQLWWTLSVYFTFVWLALTPTSSPSTTPASTALHWSVCVTSGTADIQKALMHNLPQRAIIIHLHSCVCDWALKVEILSQRGDGLFLSKQVFHHSKKKALTCLM